MQSARTCEKPAESSSTLSSFRPQIRPLQAPGEGGFRAGTNGNAAEPQQQSRDWQHRRTPERKVQRMFVPHGGDVRELGGESWLSLVTDYITKKGSSLCAGTQGTAASVTWSQARSLQKEPGPLVPFALLDPASASLPAGSGPGCQAPHRPQALQLRAVFTV